MTQFASFLLGENLRNYLKNLSKNHLFIETFFFLDDTLYLGKD